MHTNSRLLLLPALALGLCASPTAAHGGTYRGPGSGIPPSGGTPTPATGTGPGAAPPSGPSTGASDAAGDLTAWQLWWGFNREPYLGLRTALGQAAQAFASPGASGASTGFAPRPTDDQVRAQVVPALLGILQSERNPDIAGAALLALAKVGLRLAGAQAADAADAIRARLSDANQEVAETAALALGILARPQEVSNLVDILTDSDAGRRLCGRERIPLRTRAFAAYALGLCASRNTNPDLRRWAVHHLARAAETADGATRDVPVAALMALGLVPLPPAEIALDGDTTAPPSSMLEAQVRFLAAYFTDTQREASLRAYAAVPLARLAILGGEDERGLATQTLAEVLQPGSREPAVVRQAAATALGIVADGDSDAHDVRARALLKQAAGEGDRLARRLASISFARAAARPGSAGEVDLTDSRAWLAGELARGSTPERPWFSLALGVGEHAARGAGLPGSLGVQQALQAALTRHASPAESGAHALGLALAAGESAQPALLRQLAELRDDDARAHCAVALGLARCQAAVAPLRELVVTSQYRPHLLRESAIALGLLGDRELTPVLVDMLRTARGLTALSAIATALGWVGDERAVEPLLAIAADSSVDASARAFAVVALGIVCDPAPLPWNTPYAVDSSWWLPPATLYDPLTSTGVLDLL